MNTGRFQHFIPQNAAPYDVVKIAVCRGGEKRGEFNLQHLRLPRLGEKLYSFGALSDVHIVYDTATEDFQRALTYLNNDVDVAFTCIAGDLTDVGTDEQLALYRSVVDEYSSDTPVYAIAGNHEASKGAVTDEKMLAYTGKPRCYTFEYGNDVFIMMGCRVWADDGSFTDADLQWLYELLEANRDKRCFIFIHVFPWGDSGNPLGLYSFDMFTGTRGDVFLSLLKHYKNTILFHGHSHTKFYLQEADEKANYSEAQGYRSVHIPSLAVPRDLGSNSFYNVYADSEGYVVDVYKNHVILRGRDFVAEKFLPIATYCLDTKPQTVEAGTYTDSTGTIQT